MSDIINNNEFSKFRDFIYNNAGIDLVPSKKAMVCSRLGKRLRFYKMKNYGEYFNFITNKNNQHERQLLINLLTTTETYFFRELVHFDFLRNSILETWNAGMCFRAWSAASSEGQEAYSIAMLLADVLGKQPWEVVGSDLNTSVLEKARTGHYPTDRIAGIPQEYLKEYCLRGTGPYEGSLLVHNKIRQRVRFTQINLNDRLPDIGIFNVIFLRNILIYFDQQTQNKVVQRIRKLLKPGGYLFVGHSESLREVDETWTNVAPTIYQAV